MFGQNKFSISLEHIYTGCYCFRLATYYDDSIRTARQLMDRPRFLYTDVTEYDVFKWNLTLDLTATSEQYKYLNNLPIQFLNEC